MKSHDKPLQQFRIGTAAGHARERERKRKRKRNSSSVSLSGSLALSLERRKNDQGPRVSFPLVQTPFPQKRERAKQRRIDFLHLQRRDMMFVPSLRIFSAILAKEEER